MIDVKASNEKLIDRARRIFRTALPKSPFYDVSRDGVVDALITACDGSVKLALVVAKLGCTSSEGKNKLESTGGALREAWE
jgi:N-acetylmuramic acid 6-phosphate etherase